MVSFVGMIEVKAAMRFALDIDLLDCNPTSARILAIARAGRNAILTQTGLNSRHIHTTAIYCHSRGRELAKNRDGQSGKHGSYRRTLVHEYAITISGQEITLAQNPYQSADDVVSALRACVEKNDETNRFEFAIDLQQGLWKEAQIEVAVESLLASLEQSILIVQDVKPSNRDKEDKAFFPTGMAMTMILMIGITAILSVILTVKFCGSDRKQPRSMTFKAVNYPTHKITACPIKAHQWHRDPSGVIVVANQWHRDPSGVIVVGVSDLQGAAPIAPKVTSVNAHHEV